MEITFQIENSFFVGAIDLGKHIRVDVLENFLVTGQVVFQFLVIILVFVHKISDDFYYFWLKHVFTVQMQEVFFLANVPVKTERDALLPKLVDHLVLAFVRQFSVQQERI